MDIIKNQTITLFPEFWSNYIEFSDSKSNNKFNHKILLKKEDKFKFNSVVEASINKIDDLFTLYYFLIDLTDKIYNNKCDDYNEILANLSIFSLWCIELDKILRLELNIDNSISTDIMNELIMTSNIETNMNNKQISKLLSVKNDNENIEYFSISKIKEKVYNLYLKLIRII